MNIYQLDVPRSESDFIRKCLRYGLMKGKDEVNTYLKERYEEKQMKIEYIQKDMMEYREMK